MKKVVCLIVALSLIMVSSISANGITINDEENAECEQTINEEQKEKVQLIKPDIILNLEKLNFYNPIEFIAMSNNNYNVRIFAKLFDYGDVKLSIESTDGEIAIDNVINKNDDVELTLNENYYSCEIHVSKKDGGIITFLGEITADGKLRNYENLMLDEGDYDKIPVINSDESINSIITMSTKTEIEPNNSFSQAYTIRDDDDVIGTMYSDREDFYKITFSKSGKANFWLGNIPSGKNHDLYVYEGNSSYPKWSSTKATGTQELINLVSIKSNTTYYIKVMYPSGSMPTNANYLLRVKYYENPSYLTSSTAVNACFGYCPRYNGTYHRGIDILPVNSGVDGDNIKSILSGYVISSFYDTSNGNVVAIRHLQNPALVSKTDKYLNSRYLHLKSKSVTSNANVTNGQVIGTMGNTGTSSEGVHLHFEVGSHNNASSNRWDGALMNPISNFFPNLVCNHNSLNYTLGLQNELDKRQDVGILINSVYYIDVEYLENMTSEELSKFGIDAYDLLKFKELTVGQSELSVFQENIDSLINELAD